MLEPQSRRGAQLVPQCRVVEQPWPVDQRADDVVARDQLGRVVAGRRRARRRGAPTRFRRSCRAAADRGRRARPRASRASRRGAARPRALPRAWPAAPARAAVAAGPRRLPRRGATAPAPGMSKETVELVVGDESAAHAVRELHRAQRHVRAGRDQNGASRSRRAGLDRASRTTRTATTTARPAAPAASPHRVP